MWSITGWNFAGGKADEPDGETVLIAQADLDSVVLDHYRDVLTWDGSHGAFL
jgi:hypothetical protein